MKTFNSFLSAEYAACDFFYTHFGHNSGVGYSTKGNNIIEFYSKEDPAMNDTYFAIINDGMIYTMKDGVLYSHVQECNETDKDFVDKMFANNSQLASVKANEKQQPDPISISANFASMVIERAKKTMDESWPVVQEIINQSENDIHFYMEQIRLSNAVNDLCVVAFENSKLCVEISFGRPVIAVNTNPQTFSPEVAEMISRNIKNKDGQEPKVYKVKEYYLSRIERLQKLIYSFN